MKDENAAGEPMVEYVKPLDFEQVWQMFQETDRFLTEKFQETDKLLTEMFAETDRRFRATDKKLNKLEALFTSQWGKLVESLVKGDLIKLLNCRGIKVESVMQRRSGSKDGHSYEFDLIAVNDTDLVIVEVKTTLRPDDVSDFIEKLDKARIFMPEYRDRTLYGAVAWISADEGSERMAEKQGLFVIRATGSSSSVINAPDFIPRKF